VGWFASGGGLGGGGRVGLGLRLGGGVLTGGVGAVQGLVLTATYLSSPLVGAGAFLVVVVVLVVVVTGRRVLGGGVGLSYRLLGVVLGLGVRLGGSGSLPDPLVGEGLDVQDGVESDLM